MITDVKNNGDDDLLPDVEEDLSGEDDEEGDGEDQAALALNTPDPARALQASRPDAKGKGGPKSKKGMKGKAADRASAGDEGRAIDVTIGDKATGLEESSTEEKPDAQMRDLSAFDRDEITDPDMDIHESEFLAMLAGLAEKPWENEKLSVTERMMLKQGYERNVEALKQARDEKDMQPESRKRSAPGVAAAVVTGVVAAGGVAAGLEGGAEKGPSIAGVSRGPQRAADQETTTRTQVKVEVRKKVATETALLQARQNTEDVTLRRMGPGLASSLVAGKTNPPTRQEQQDPSAKLMQDLIEDLAVADHSGTALQMTMPDASPDPDMQFRQMMEMIYMSLGTEMFMNVSPYREAGWDQKRLEQKENSADVTVAPEPEKDPGPAPKPEYRHDTQMNIGPGGAG